MSGLLNALYDGNLTVSRGIVMALKYEEKRMNRYLGKEATRKLLGKKNPPKWDRSWSPEYFEANRKHGEGEHDENPANGKT
jgi:hypothetical protein